MRRPLLLSFMALGAAVTLSMGAGTFAVFTDRATTDRNSAASAALPRAADLQLAFAVSGPSACPTASYVEDNATPVMTMTNVEPGSRDQKFFCLKNVGSATLDVTSTVIDLVDLDTDCTGDESAVDQTCGGNGQGELGNVLAFYPTRFDCSSGSGTQQYGGFLSAPTPVSLGSLAPAEIMCGSIEVFYPLNRSTDDQLRAQSDTATWRFAFDGATAT